MTPVIYKGDVGTTFRLSVVDQDGAIVDLSAATVKQVRFARPDGTAEVKAAGFFTDGTDGVLEYQTQPGDLDEAGRWSWQGYVELPGGKWHTTRLDFEVREPVPGT